MYSSRTLPASVAPPVTAGTAEKQRPTVDKQQSFIQRFYLFGTNPHSSSSSSSSSSSRSSASSSGGDSPGTSSPSPAAKKTRKKLEDGEELHGNNYSVQRLKQFWNNRLSVGAAGVPQPSEIALSRKLKSVTLGPSNPSRKPATPEFLRRNGSTRGSASRRNIVRNSLVPLYSNLGGAKKVGSPKVSRVSREVERNDSVNQKRTSVVLSPVRDQKKDKRSCLDRVGYNAGFPLVTATANGGRINWARRVELLGIRSLSSSSNEELPKMPLKTENFVGNFIGVDIQSGSPPPEDPSPAIETTPKSPKLGLRDSLDSKKSSSSSDTHSLGRRHGTPTRKVSFRTTTSPYNRKLLNPSGNKVAALTNKFNKLIQQDAGILEEVRKRGGYLHKSGGHVYKVIDSDGSSGSLRKKPPSSGSCSRTDESSDDVSVGSKGSYRKSGVKKRPSLRKNLYRRPELEVNRVSMCVKQALEIFEPNQHQQPKVDRKPPAGRSKPKVPDKSEQVIQKTKELKCKTKPQIETKSCDSENNSKQSSGEDQQKQVVACNEVPNSVSEDVSIKVEERSEIDGITQVEKQPEEKCEEKKTVPPPETPEYSEVVKKPEVVPEVAPEKQKKDKKQKSTVQKIYEKFTFRSTKKINLSSSERAASESQLNTVTPEAEDKLLFVPDNRLTRKSFVSSIEIPTVHIEEPQESSSDPADRKIVDAIASLNHKIDNLSKSFNDLCLKDSDEEVEPTTTVQPNNSFLFRSMSKISNGNETAVSQLNIAQAINTVVINKSLSMDAHNFPCRNNLDRLSLNEKIPTTKPIENDYELVSRVESPKKLETSSSKGSTMSIDLVELTSKIESFVYKAKNSDSNLYQSPPKPPQADTISINSYESFENYESIERPHDQPPKEEDTYEICNPPEPLPPRNTTTSPNDLQIPQPKRNLTASPKFSPKSLQPTYTSNYEKIKYDQTPPLRPPKPEEVPLPPRNNIPKDNHSPTPSSEEPIYEENIYDTIKSCDGLDYDDPNGSSAEAEVIKRPKAQLPPPPQPDSISITSADNCYESIGTKLGALSLPRMGSISTLASDQITNSLYGLHTGGANSLTPPSERGGGGERGIGGVAGSDSTSNSAEWTDISDDEDEGEGEARPSQFIIVRKRNKTHQTPVWSRKVRHTMAAKQQQQHHQNGHLQQDHPKGDDDSDHVYESLDSHGQSRPGGAATSTHTFRNLRAVPVPPPHGMDPQTPGSAWSSVDYGHGRAVEETLLHDDDFDSFDSDNESDEDHHRKNDSGVDISNVKLPDPPASSGQVYALMQKIKSLGTLSKSEIAKGLHKLSKKKTSTSKSPKIFTGEGLTSPAGNEETVVNYENAPLPKVPKSKSKSFKLPLQLGPAKPVEDYENKDFLNPLAATTPTGSPSPNGSALASSPASEQADKSIIASISNSDSSNVSTFRKKSKSGKSLRSKLRKSLQSESSLNIGSSFNGSRSTFYVTDSLDVDSGIFNGSEPTSSSSNLNVAASERDPTPMIYSPPKTPHKTPDADRRKSAGGGSPASRPTIPPPPPPTNANGSAEKKSPKNRKLGATSWYAECGVFKSESLKQAENELKNKERTTTSWYAEVGLYQTSGASVASSSESSGVSTGGEGGPGDDHSHSMFVNEPLYQIYNAAKLESLTRDIDAEITGGDTELYDDGYEKISDHGKECSSSGDESGGGGRKLRPSAFELIEPNVGKLRTLWCEIPEVINSEILLTLTPTEKRLQEAKFEILTSEASYLKSLNLLRSHFINHPAFRDVKVLTSSERKTLFSNIIPVQECSDRLLCDLENCWQDNIMLLGLSHSIYKHAEKHFHVYVNYCEHQAKIDRTLKNLKVSKGEFTKTLVELESDPVCCGLSLSSFLMLPMQRITRMRLLLDAVLQRLKTDDDEFQSWEKTFVLINRILTQCNDAAHRSEQMHEMETISRNIEFPTHIRPLAIVPCGIGSPGSVIRKLEKRGELVHLMWRGDDAKLTFGKKFSKSSIYAFLFTDLLVLTKKKGDETYLVTDYCPRALLTVNSGDVVPQLPTKEMQAIGKHLIIMTLLENHEGKTVEMIVSCPSETERERWLKVTEPLSSENPDEKIYEQWDCPQVIAVHPYQALQPDELDLDIKDVVNVHRKMADGWYEGERIRDGAIGWFPGNYTKEILTAHVRAKHIKQRHMLLSYTSKYIDTNTRTLQHPKK